GNDFRNWIENHSDFEIMAPVPFSTICFRANPENFNEEELNKLNENLMNRINETGKLFLTHTKLNGKFVIRLVISGIRTEERHVEAAKQLIQQKLDESLEPNKT
ncbi:MAG: amino acid decarboxylase, partial [Ignavibacteriaceae bacterium]